MTKEQDRAVQNARAWSETIVALVSAMNADYDRLQELRDEKAALLAEVGDKHSDFDTAAMRKAREALSVWIQENGDELRELEEAVTVDGDAMSDADAARERIQESPLSVMVRGDWYSPGQAHDALEPVEFEILLSTGGPALRIRGELDEHCQPYRAWFEYQDWGTPWTEFHGEGAPAQETLLAFCQCFYFGE